MRLVSTYLKSAFTLLSIFLPIMHADGMSYLPKWFSKTPKAAEQAVKKEAAKVVTEKVIEKTTPGQYAAQSALAVARVAGNTAIGTAEFAINNPKLTTIAVVGTALYLNRKKIKKKLEEYAPYLKTAGAGVAVAGALIAGKNLHDLLKSNPNFVKLLLGSGSDLQAVDPLPQLKAFEEVWKQGEQKQKQESAVAQKVDSAEEVDYGALWDECQEKNNEEERARVESERQKELAVQAAVWKEAEHARVQAAAEELKKQEDAWQEVQRTQEQEAERARIKETKEKRELEIHEAAWQEAERARDVEPQKELAPQAAQELKNKQEAAPRKISADHITCVEPRPVINTQAIQNPAYDHETGQLMRRFTHPEDEQHVLHQARPLIHGVYAPQQVVVRDADTPWVEEFNEMEERELANNAWAEEFKQQHENEKALEAIEESDAQPVALVSDQSTFGAAQDVRDLRDFEERYDLLNHAYERSPEMSRSSSSVQRGRTRIIFQNHDATVQPYMQPARVAPVQWENQNTIPAEDRRRDARIPARL